MNLSVAKPLIKAQMQKAGFKTVVVKLNAGEVEIEGYGTDILEQYNTLLEKCKELEKKYNLLLSKTN